MALAAFQRALATLYVDPAARAAFAGDADTYARSYGLDAIEAERLRLLGIAHAETYARTLGRKRRNELARLASRTRIALGEEWGAAVRRYLATLRPGAESHAVPDARRFARFVAGDRAYAAARPAALEDLRALR